MSFEDWLANFHMLQLCHLATQQSLPVCIQHSFIHSFMFIIIIVLIFGLVDAA